MLDEIQQRGLGPVHVVDEQDDRAVLGESLEKPSHRPEQLLGGPRRRPGDQCRNGRGNAVGVVGQAEASSGDRLADSAFIGRFVETEDESDRVDDRPE